MQAQSTQSPGRTAGPAAVTIAPWPPAPRITLRTVRSWLDHAIVTRDTFPHSNFEAVELLAAHGYRPVSDIAWELASNPLMSIALVRAVHTRTGESVKVPVLEYGLYSEIAGWKAAGHATS